MSLLRTRKASGEEVDFSNEAVVVGVVEIKVYLQPNNRYVAKLVTPDGPGMSSEERNFANAAMRDLLEKVIDNPVFQGQM